MASSAISLEEHELASVLEVSAKATDAGKVYEFLPKLTPDVGFVCTTFVKCS